jgi:peptidoglycan/LPS O-acetylase OafA/YrhL
VQRFFPQPEGFFTVAWSLAMEEWFYLLFPALALLTGAVLRRRDRRGIVLWTGVSVIILCCAARYAAIDLNLDWPILLGDLSFARHPILRLDCCAYGVVLAALVHGEGTRVAPAVGRLTPPGALGLCALPIIGLGALFVILAPSDPALQLRIFFPHWAVEYFTFDYPLLDCAAAGIVAIAYFASPALSPRLAGAIGLFSRASYSLYLVHTLGNFLWLGPLLLVLGPAGGIAAHLVLAVLLAIASYYAIERPFLSLRDRFFPSASTTG